MNNSFNGLVIEDDRTIDQAMSLQNLQIAGNCYFMDTVEADRLQIEGEGKFSSFVTCDRLWVSGNAYMMQTLLTETIQNTGNLTVLGRCISDVAVFEGRGIFHGPFSTGRLLVKSPSTVEYTGRVKADRITVAGQMLGTAKVRCREVEFISCFSSDVHEISADFLRVAYQVPQGQLALDCAAPILTVAFMDVSTAVLEYTHVQQLFCDKAVIGKGCRIKELIYRDGIEIESGAVVERLSKA